MIIDVAPLLEPVSADEPGGSDVRETEDYEAVAAEIEKMTSPTSTGQIDWQRVEAIGTRLFASQGKDFMLAAWVSAAWTERYGIEGLGAGLLLLDGLVTRYWDSAFPPLKRLRGRRNALVWWTDRSSGWLENKDIPPLREETRQAMLAAAESLDSRLAEFDPDAPPLHGFLQQIRRLEVIPAAPAAAPDEGDSATPGADADAVTAPGGPPPDGMPAAGQGIAAATPPSTAGSAAATQASVAASAPAPVAASSAPRAYTAAAQPADGLDSIDAIIDALAPALHHVGQITSALRTLDRFNPLAIEMGRLAARGTLLGLPPAQGAATQLMPPPVAITDAFATIARSGNADGLIEFCESRIPSFPYWLDLDRESARGFGLLGEQGAPMRDAIIGNALSFIKRLPGIERLTFSDGTPFADENTLQWLETCKAERQGGGNTLDRVGRVRQQAQEAIDGGRHDEALQAWQSLIDSTAGGRDRFRGRLALAEAMLAMGDDADLLPLAASLAKACRKRQLGEWEPALAAQAWQFVLRAARRAQGAAQANDDEDRGDDARELISRAQRELAAIDPVTAARLR